jgi:O-6-methylguanine DNA methyltransferase
VVPARTLAFAVPGQYEKERFLKYLANKVAVVTGAASGIGFAMAERFSREGMKVVLADVEAGALARAETELRARGATVLAARTDVSRAEDVEQLADKTLAAFGEVHLVCNNAGVAIFKSCWEHTIADWEWVLGVNLWGVIHGIRTFVPLLLRQGGEGHIVNTASVAGLVTSSFYSSYHASKHAVVAISEDLSRELADIGSQIGVSVLCPGPVRTEIMTSARNRPANGEKLAGPGEERLEARAAEKSLGDLIGNHGALPTDVADLVVDAIRAGTFYILPHPEYNEHIRNRMEDIVTNGNPTNVRRGRASASARVGTRKSAMNGTPLPTPRPTIVPKTKVAVATLTTRFGRFGVFGTHAGLLSVVLPNETMPDAESRLRRTLGEVEFVEDPESLAEALEQLEGYFDGTRRSFDLVLDPRGTPFQRSVWDALQTIGYGKTASYGDIARAIGKSPASASRAVGAANGQNPLPIVVPCHRIIGSNGTLTGYGGGLELKQQLLELERGTA